MWNCSGTSNRSGENPPHMYSSPCSSYHKHCIHSSISRLSQLLCNKTLQKSYTYLSISDLRCRRQRRGYCWRDTVTHTHYPANGIDLQLIGTSLMHPAILQFLSFGFLAFLTVRQTKTLKVNLAVALLIHSSFPRRDHCSCG